MVPGDLQTEIIKTVVQILIENAFKYAQPITKKIIEQARSVRIKKVPNILKSSFVGQENARQSIESVVWEKKTTRIIYLQGDGGAGKTRLLEEVQKQVLNSKSAIRWAGIFDFYHTDLHNVLHLQSNIVDKLDAMNLFFQQFRFAREQFLKKRRDGMFSLSVDAGVHIELSQLNKLFLEELNQFTNKYRVVIALDTLENVGEWQDDVQKAFGLEFFEENSTVKQWLIDLVRIARNTVVLLAGRPNDDLTSSFGQVNEMMPGRFELIKIEKLTRVQTASLLKLYVQELPKDIKEIITQSAERILDVIDGSPVRLALIVELLAQNLLMIETLKNNNIVKLNSEIIRAFFEIEYRRLFFFLALARKGLSSDLLHYLQPDWSKNECVQKMEELEQVALVKKRPEDNNLFLHDAIYELFDQCSDQFAREQGGIHSWFRQIFEYYQTFKITDGYTQQQTIIVNQLFYGLRHDSLQAFYSIFAQWSEISIKGFEIEFETQLRDEVCIYLDKKLNIEQSAELGLTRNIYNQDNIVRWLKRLIMRSRYEDAAEIAETILISIPNDYWSSIIGEQAKKEINLREKKFDYSIISSPRPFFWGHLLTYYGEALTYLANQDEAKVKSILLRAIQILDGSATDIGENDSRWWLKNRLLGRAHDRLGYLSRTKGELMIAVKHYKKALSLFKKIGIEDEYAFTQNNLAFVYALLGNVAQAQIAAKDALKKRNKLGQRFPLALSFNTSGLINALDDPTNISGEQDCKRALSIFEEINSPRGIGLACNALGYILRKRGSEWTIKRCTTDQAIQWYEESERFLERSKKIFQQGEKIRLWEAYNELGSLNRSWGQLLRTLNFYCDSDKKFAKAIEAQKEALEIVQDGNRSFQLLDTLDDLIQVYLDLRDLEQAKICLDQCQILLSKDLNSEKSENKAGSGEIYWLSLAKTQLKNGSINILSSRTEQTCDNSGVILGIRQVLISYVYFQYYSVHHRYLEKKAQGIASILKEFDIPGTMIKDAFERIAQEYNVNLSILCFALSQEYAYEEITSIVMGKP